jgi:hypothetical protein
MAFAVETHSFKYRALPRRLIATHYQLRQLNCAIETRTTKLVNDIEQATLACRLQLLERVGGAFFSVSGAGRDIFAMWTGGGDPRLNACVRVLKETKELQREKNWAWVRH